MNGSSFINDVGVVDDLTYWNNWNQLMTDFDIGVGNQGRLA